jgi:SAM-dependent methyltransferase
MAADKPNVAMTDFWNTNGEVWARFQAQLDRQLAPLGEAAMRALALAPGDHILDIGCGCGDTTLALAASVGPTGMAIGVDVSVPMLDVARARAAEVTLNVQFVEADVQAVEFAPPAFDAAFSRFGVMFFSDPPAAFANIRKAMKSGARLAFVCWRPFAENPWMRDPMVAAQPFLPPQASPDPLAPGPFAFADPDRVRTILTTAGFRDVAINPFDTRIGGSTVDQTLALAFRIGPLGAALRDRPDLTDSVAGVVRSLLTRYDTPEGVMIPAAVWIVTANA